MKDDIDYVERKVTPNRTQLVAMRKSQARLEANMPAEFVDAMREIERAFNADMVFLGYQTMDLPGMGGGGKSEIADASAEQIEKIQRWRQDFTDWAKRCEGRDRGITLDVSIYAWTIYQIAEMRSMKERMVTQCLHRGLNEWCIVKGWGDFLNKIP